MIRTAITKLNEEGGSTAESISGFIEKEYEDLPWAHTAFLSHHLRKLCGTGEIVGKNDGRYVINADCYDFGDEEGIGHSMNIREGGEILHTCYVGDGFQTELKEKIIEDCHLIKQKIEAESQAGGKEIEVLNKWNKVKEKQIEMREECCQVEKQEVEESEVSRWDFEATVQQVEEPFMELVKKKTESQEQLMENSLSLGGMELLEYDNSGPVMEEEKKDSRKVDQQQLIKSPCTEEASNIEVIEGQKLVQEQEDKLNKQSSQPHQIEVETNVFELCCYSTDVVSKNFWASDSPLPLAKKEQKGSLKLEQQQAISTIGEKQFIIVCGLQAQKLSQQRIFGQQKALNSHLDIEQQKQPDSSWRELSKT